MGLVMVNNMIWAPAGTPWTPHSLNPFVWWDAESIRMYNATLIDRVYNQGAISNTIFDLASDYASYRATLVSTDTDFNNYPSLSWSPEPAYLQSGDIASYMNNSITYYFVIKTPPSFINYNILLGPYDRIIKFTSAGYLNFTASWGIQTAALSTNTTYVVCIVYNHSTGFSQIYVNNHSIAAADGETKATNIVSLILLGNNYAGTNPFNGKMAHTSIYTGNHNETVRGQTMGYLGNKYNIATT